jgi:hypothetical protein
MTKQHFVSMNSIKEVQDEMSSNRFTEKLSLLSDEVFNDYELA